MRTLSGLANQSLFTPRLTASILAADQSTTYVHGMDSIAGIGPITWEVEFTGGLAKVGTYQLTLAMSLDAIKARLPKYLKGTCTLRVDVGSSTFYPHVGVVRGYQRPDAPLLQLQVVDRFQDVDPLVPVASIPDSYGTPHPVHLSDGRPLYYGRHQRPIYHTAVASDGSDFLPPLNISSANHVTSVWFCSDLAKGPATGSAHNLLLDASWPAAAGHLTTVGAPFVVRDAPGAGGRFWRYDPAQMNAGFVGVTSRGDVQVIAGGLVRGHDVFIPGIPDEMEFVIQLSKLIPQEVAALYRMDYALRKESALKAVEVGYPTLYTFVPSGPGNVFNQITGTTSFNAGEAQLVGSATLSAPSNLGFTGNTKLGVQFTALGSGGTLGQVYSVLSLAFYAQLASAAYKRYSVFSPPVNSSEVAVSANPFAILDDVFSHATGTPYRQDQSSAAQVAAQSHQFQCLLGPERQRLSAIADEFARITATHLWLGDCGLVNYRTYQLSGQATVNKTVSPADMGWKTFRLTEAPVGSTLYEADQASRVKVRFGYDYQTGQYASLASGVNCMTNVSAEKQFDTKVILDPFTGSLYLANMMRKYTQSREVVEFDLGPAHLDLELCDVLAVQHPMLVGSQGLYQIKGLDLDLQAWKLHVTACKLIA